MPGQIGSVPGICKGPLESLHNAAHLFRHLSWKRRYNDGSRAVIVSAKRCDRAANVSAGLATGMKGQTDKSAQYRLSYPSNFSSASTTPLPSPLILSVPPA